MRRSGTGARPATLPSAAVSTPASPATPTAPRGRHRASWVARAWRALDSGLGSVDSVLSLRSRRSQLSALSSTSLLSAASVGSILSIGSAGSVLSIASAGSVLSIGSAGSVMSLGSAGCLQSRWSLLSVGGRAERFVYRAQQGVPVGLATLAVVAALLGGDHDDEA